MEIDAMIREMEEEEEDYYKESEDEVEAEDPLFFMEHNHDQLRAQEESDAQDYWESGISSATINVLKQGNMDHSMKVCYHCSHKGHIKANCPSRKKLESRPWEHRPARRDGKKFTNRGYGTRKEQGRSSAGRSDFTKRTRYGGAQAIYQEDF